MRVPRKRMGRHKIGGKRVFSIETSNSGFLHKPRGKNFSVGREEGNCREERLSYATDMRECRHKALKKKGRGEQYSFDLGKRQRGTFLPRNGRRGGTRPS